MRVPLLIAVLSALSSAAAGEDGGLEDRDFEDASSTTPGLVVSAHLEPDRVRLGQPFELVVDIRRPPGERLQLPDRIDGGDLEIIGPPSRSLATDGDTVVETVRLKLAAFALEDVRTPHLVLSGTDGSSYEVLPIPVQIERSLAPERAKDGMAGSADPVQIERFDERPVAMAAAVVLFFAVLGVLVWLHRRRGPPAAPAVEERVEPPPDVVALHRLRQLERSPLIQRGELDLFVDEVIEVMRWYLGKRYGISALDMTSSELHAALDRVLDANLDVTQVDRVLSDADLVKFARAPTTAQACARLIQDVRTLVETTRLARRGRSQEAA